MCPRDGRRGRRSGNLGGWRLECGVGGVPRRGPTLLRTGRGITIYHVSKAAEKDSNYTYYRATTDFALTTRWEEFLDAWAQ